MARKTKKEEVEKENEIKDTGSVVNDSTTVEDNKEEVKQKHIEAKPRKAASPVVVASYRVPERKKNNHIVLYIAIACFLLYISTIILSIIQYKTSKKVDNLLQENKNMELIYLQLSDKYDDLSEKYNELSEQHEEIVEFLIEKDLME